MLKEPYEYKETSMLALFRAWFLAKAFGGQTGHMSGWFLHSFYIKNVRTPPFDITDVVKNRLERKINLPTLPASVAASQHARKVTIESSSFRKHPVSSSRIEFSVH
jgi:hypothetical protein